MFIYYKHGFMTILFLVLLNQIIHCKYSEQVHDYYSNKVSCGNKTFIVEPNGYDNVHKQYDVNKTAICEACELALPIIRKLIASNKTEHFQSILTFVCKEFKLASPIVCELFIKEKEVYIDII